MVNLERRQGTAFLASARSDALGYILAFLVLSGVCICDNPLSASAITLLKELPEVWTEGQRPKLKGGQSVVIV